MDKADLRSIKTPLYKSYKMEDFLDLYFYHPLGLFFAKLSCRMAMTPNQVSIVSMCVGIAGGALLISNKTAFWGFLLIVFSSILDSSDGQLARMTGNSSLAGRVLDGLIGYVSFTVAYVAMAMNYYLDSHDFVVFFIMFLAGFFSIIHSGMYDFYRTSFSKIISGGEFFQREAKEDLKGFFSVIYSVYNFIQARFAFNHINILKRLQEASLSPEKKEKISRIYDEVNLKNVHFWNMLGDNVKVAGIFIALLLGKMHWYFYYIIVFMNVIFAIAFVLQRKSDNLFNERIKPFLEES